MRIKKGARAINRRLNKIIQGSQSANLNKAGTPSFLKRKKEKAK